MEQNGIKLGTYEHYTGNKYEVIGVAKHKETNEDLVVLRALFDGYGMWVRPLATFSEDVDMHGDKVPRYKYIGD